jgi:hypothetical protein
MKPTSTVTTLVFQSTNISTTVAPSVEAPNRAPNISVKQSNLADELLLPKDVTPSHYRLRLEPYLEDAGPDGKNFTYKGHVSITIHCHSTTNKVSVHAKDLDIGQDIKMAVVNGTAARSTALTAVSASLEENSSSSESGFCSVPSFIVDCESCSNPYCLCMWHFYISMLACTIYCSLVSFIYVFIGMHLG